MSLRIHRRDTELRFVTKFGENRQIAKLPIGLLGYHTKELGLRGTSPRPYFAKNGPIAPKIP